MPSRIEGIGRPRVEPSFIGDVIDEVLPVKDAASLAAIRMLRERTRHWAGGSTGTNLIGAFQLISRMLAAGERGSVVTLICDGGARYEATHYDDEWVASQGLDLAPERARIDRFFATGEWESD
jgi:cysteine synthase A